MTLEDFKKARDALRKANVTGDLTVFVASDHPYLLRLKEWYEGTHVKVMETK